GADAEPAAGVWLRVGHLEDFFAVAPVLDEGAVGDEGDGLLTVRGDAEIGMLRDREIVLPEQRALDGIADIAAEARGGVAVAAKAHVVHAQRVVVREFTAARMGE